MTRHAAPGISNELTESALIDNGLAGLLPGIDLAGCALFHQASPAFQR